MRTSTNHPSHIQPHRAAKRQCSCAAKRQCHCSAKRQCHRAAKRPSQRAALRGESAIAAVSGSNHGSSFIIHHSSFARSAFTLVELLVTIVIISILAGMVLGGVRAAQQAAAVAGTNATIAKLNNQLQVRYESYRTRRLLINPSTWDPGATPNPTATPPTPLTDPTQNAAFSPRHAAAHRLVAMRELMRMELPDRWSDVIDDPQVFVFAPQPHLPSLSVAANNRAKMPRSAVSKAYKRRYDNAATKPTAQFEDAECLYLIVTLGLGDSGLATDQITARDIGDADGDGFPEFHDGWGNPIRFLRWAPGFVSDLQPSDAKNSPTDPRFVDSRHDPFDPLKMQNNPNPNPGDPPPAGFALFPLVYSMGPDGIDDIYHTGTLPAPVNGQYEAVSATFNVTEVYSGTAYSFTMPYNPYQQITVNGVPTTLGAPLDTDGDGVPDGYSLDNVHNHANALK